MRFITASKIFSGNRYLADQSVLVLNDQNFIIDVIQTSSLEQGNIEYFEGILCPGFVNTHCHLELSHLQGKIPRHTGMVDFALRVIQQRGSMPEEWQLECMRSADRCMQQAGIVAVGDVSNTSLSATVKKESGLFYHTFVELIGFNPSHHFAIYKAGKGLANRFAQYGLPCSLSPHAPYSASLPLIKKIATDCEMAELPMTIHNQESEAENVFFKHKTGDYLRLYEALSLPLDHFQASGKSSLQTIVKSLSEHANTLLVHNTFTHADDIRAVLEKHQNTYWCLCPNANVYIENTFPDVELFRRHQCHLTLGTDSLASNESLSMMDEMNCLLKKYPSVEMEFLLQMATYNGAKYLGIEHQFGVLEKNKKPGINLVQLKDGTYSVKKLA